MISQPPCMHKHTCMLYSGKFNMCMYVYYTNLCMFTVYTIVILLLPMCLLKLECAMYFTFFVILCLCVQGHIQELCHVMQMLVLVQFQLQLNVLHTTSMRHSFAACVLLVVYKSTRQEESYKWIVSMAYYICMCLVHACWNLHTTGYIECVIHK